MKRLIMCLFAAVMMLCAFGCMKPGLQAEEIRLIGVLQPNLTSSWQLQLKKDIDNAINEYDDIKCIYADAGNNVKKQIVNIEEMIKRKVDVIIVFPCDEQAIAPALKNAVEQGIYVIILGYAPHDASAFTLQLFVNNYKIGYTAGEHACSALKSKGIILEIQDDASLRFTQELKKGFLAAIEQCPDIEKEYVVVGYGTKDNAQYALTTSEILEETDATIDYVFAHNNEMAKGANAVFSARGRRPIIIGTGIDIPDNMENTSIDATVIYQTLGKEAVQYAVRMMDGQVFEKSVEFDPVLFVEGDDEI